MNHWTHTGASLAEFAATVEARRSRRRALALYLVASFIGAAFGAAWRAWG